MHAFSSHHPGGVNFCFVDGAVHFISDDIDSDNAGLDYGNGGNEQDFLDAAEHGDIGVYQLLGVRNDCQTTKGVL